MSRTLLATVLLVALGSVLGPTPPARADDAADAARIATLLSSGDAAERAQGEALLLERLRAGGDLPGFLHALADRVLEARKPSDVVVPWRVVIYDVADLMEPPGTPEGVRALIEGVVGRAAVQVNGANAVVTASDAKHEALREALRRARASRVPDAPAAAPVPAPVPAAAPPKPPASEVQVYLDVSVLRVPRDRADGLLGGAGARVRPLEERALAEVREALRGIPGREEVSAPKILAFVSQEASVWIGETVPYRRDVAKDAAGGWKVVEGRIDTGWFLRTTPEIVAGRLRVPVTYGVRSVARPIATATVKPAADAAPVEIDVPQWTTVSATADLDLPEAGGSALVRMPGMSDDASRETLLLVVVRRL